MPAAAGLTGLLAAATWGLAARRRRGPSWASAALALIAALVTTGLSAQGYAAAIAEIDQRGGPGDGIVTVAPYHYPVAMARYRGQLPIYGYATETLPLHPETEAVLRRSLARHERLWLITAGLPPADPANGIEAWLAANAFVAEDRWLDDARLVAFVTAGQLEPLAVSARLGDQVTLAGARIGGEIARPGGTLAVELVWQVGAGWAGGALRGFVQLLTPDGRLAAGQDGAPGAGYAASMSWPPGLSVVDRRGLLLPADLPAGEYDVIAGLYDETTGQRLPVTDADGVSQGDFVRLGTVRLPTQANLHSN